MCSKYSRTTALLNRNISWTKKMLNWHIWTQYDILVHYINLVALFLTLNKYLSVICCLLTLANLYPMFHFYTPRKFWFSHVMTNMVQIKFTQFFAFVTELVKWKHNFRNLCIYETFYFLLGASLMARGFCFS